MICPSFTYGLIFFAVALVNGDGTRQHQEVFSFDCPFQFICNHQILRQLYARKLRCGSRFSVSIFTSSLSIDHTVT